VGLDLRLSLELGNALLDPIKRVGQFLSLAFERAKLLLPTGCRFRS
jgi:hypothetical protein